MKKKVVRQSALPDEQPFYLKGKVPFLLLSFFVILIYSPVLWYGFSPLDERWLILKQLGILKDPGNFPGLFEHSITGMYYRPVLMSSFMLDAILGGGGPFVFHLTNILLHILCALMLYRFFIRLKISGAIAFFSAAVFAVHPMNIHAIAWIPGRNDSLLCLFALASCLQLLNYSESKKKFHLFFHLTIFGLALLTKENAAVLPLAFFMIWRISKKEKWKSDLLLLAFGWLIVILIFIFLRMNFVTYLPLISATSLFSNGLRFLEGLIIFFGKTIFPYRQSVMAVVSDDYLIPYLILVAIFCLLVLKFGLQDKKIATLGLVWFFAFLVLPVWFGATSSNGDLYEHRGYSSIIGALLFVSQVKFNFNPVKARRGILILLILFSAKTISRCTVYKNPVSFLEAATEESPSIALMHDMLGYQYTERKEYKKALECFDEAIRLNPNRDQFYNHRGIAYYEIKNYAQALVNYNKTLSMNDTQAITLVNRSMTNFFLGNHSASCDDLAKAQKLGATGISPDFIQALYNALQTDTIELCTRQIASDSLNASNYNLRGIAELRLSQFTAAIADFNHALTLEPNDDAILSNRKLAIDYSKRK